MIDLIYCFLFLSLLYSCHRFINTQRTPTRLVNDRRSSTRTDSESFLPETPPPISVDLIDYNERHPRRRRPLEDDVDSGYVYVCVCLFVCLFK